jgi:antitoxin ChpS
MNTSTLRNWGGAIAVSLPKKVLAMLGLQAGSEVAIDVQDGKIVLSPARRRYTLARLEKEQKALDRARNKQKADAAWLEEKPLGHELL